MKSLQKIGAPDLIFSLFDTKQHIKVLNDM